MQNLFDGVMRFYCNDDNNKILQKKPLIAE